MVAPRRILGCLLCNLFDLFQNLMLSRARLCSNWLIYSHRNWYLFRLKFINVVVAPNYYSLSECVETMQLCIQNLISYYIIQVHLCVRMSVLIDRCKNICISSECLIHLRRLGTKPYQFVFHTLSWFNVRL